MRHLNLVIAFVCYTFIWWKTCDLFKHSYKFQFVLSIYKFSCINATITQSKTVTLKRLNRIFFSLQEVGKRSQLWRMTSQGLLQHEGSSVPRDPKQSPGKNNLYVLDIAAIAPQPISYVPLQLRKADPRRKSTQVWEFTEVS